MRTDHTIWVEKYRPATMDDYIGNEHLMEKVKAYINDNDIPSICLTGTAGVGKCLDFSEEVIIEIQLTDAEFKLYKKYVIE